ncbi:hypothetical protein [Desulfonema magnum]|uniref:Uncharacterized protein n=1 Tax=Desulfonema magnum TaxID=45655 RepID=A0A975BJC7_9BACT|nr:hypothetical protein [Desulfonema magnum]QTA86155.1 Uncharacterized protein dnm_021760 [Desulfonema magnum]
MSSSVQINIPNELAARLNRLEFQIPQIIELGLREFNASAQAGYKGCADILELLADLPEPEKIIELRPSEHLQRRISQLLEKNRTEGLTEAEEQEWEHYQYLEHLVRIAKAKALLKLRKCGQ